MVISTNDKKNVSHSYKIIPNHETINEAIESYRVKKIKDDPIVNAIYEWLDILISNNNDCTYILYENYHIPRMTSYEIIAIGNKLQKRSENSLFVYMNGCSVQNPDDEDTQCNENVIDCDGNQGINVYSAGTAKSKSRKLSHKLSHKLSRKLGSRKSKSRKYHKK